MFCQENMKHNLNHLDINCVEVTGGFGLPTEQRILIYHN